jgi:GNAT superfamily N-acetyltransferase
LIVACTPQRAEAEISQLSDLLMDAVNGGASVGFLPPLSRAEADAYWRSVIAAMREGSRVLLVAMDNGSLQGSVQLQLEMRANGNHRAEAVKLLVHRRARRRGLARALMAEVESNARKLGRTLLLMDTRKGGAAHLMCDALGYIPFGEVPGYARSEDGQLHATVFYYKQLT